MRFGAGSRNRTDTVFLQPDFESGASTSFAIPAVSSLFYHQISIFLVHDTLDISCTRGVSPAPVLTSGYQYDLPTALVAQAPLAERSASRLLHVDVAHDALRDHRFKDLPELLHAGDLLVFNDTRVIPARLFGTKTSGGKVELLVERIVDRQRVVTQMRASKPPKAGAVIHLEGGGRAVVRGRAGDLFELELLDLGERSVLAHLEQVGHVPLPPYIQRSDAPADRSRYQTVYARAPGAVAAPTAGLHFDEPLLQTLRLQGVDTAWVTLHVGSGTFQPLRAERLAEHRMHSEYAEVPVGTVEQVQATRARGGRVIAVGTTTVRALETAAHCDTLQPFYGDTNLFITPGFQFRCVDAMLTNFHLPGSTLLVLVCAFGGYDLVMAAYRHAVAQCYRFFSYGDAMFITR